MKSIAAPFGVSPGDTIAPEELARDFREMSALGQSPTHHQWKNDAFTSENFMKEGAPVKISDQVQGARLYQATYVNTVATPDGDDPIINDYVKGTATPDPNLFQVPFNRGLVSVTGTRVDWVSEHPELVMLMASWQYIRRHHARFGESSNLSYDVRFQARLAVDGAMIPGTGPHMNMVQTRYRGAGYARRSTSMTAVWVGVLPAGSHFVELFAGQAWAATSEHDEVVERDDPMDYRQDPPDTGVCIGNRAIIPVRFPFGLNLGA